MPAPTQITRLTIEPIDIPMDRPFGIAGGAQVVAENALVTVELADGTRGFGEAAPFPAFNGETRAGAVVAAEASRGVVEGEDARAWRRIAAALHGPASRSDRRAARSRRRCSTRSRGARGCRSGPSSADRGARSSPT
ncbi:MAG: hypothetical protein QM820_20500 [Minicystis sp.]